MDNPTIHKVRVAARAFRQYLPHIKSKIDAIVEGVENKEVLEEMYWMEMKCGCERMKREAICLFVDYNEGMLGVLRAADEDAKERQQKQGGFGPVEPEMKSFFPVPKEVSHKLSQ